MKAIRAISVATALVVSIALWILFSSSSPVDSNRELPVDALTEGDSTADSFQPRTRSAAIEPSLVKARAADGEEDLCAAPCAVHFDATGTRWTGHSKDEADLDLEYRWNFGDPSCSEDGLFEASGRSCNDARGFVAGHLFETPGTYTATLCVVDGDRGACRSTNVVVSDPNDVYPGTQTVCVSTNGNHTGCPAGARRVKSSSFGGALRAHLGPGKRVLFHRGQTFEAGATFQFGRSHRKMLVGSYGTGTKPRVEAKGALLFANTCDGPQRDGPAPVDTRIVGFEFHNGASLLALDDPAKQLTVAHNDLTGTWSGHESGQIFQWSDSIRYCESGNSPSAADQWFLVENDHARTDQGRNLTMTARRSAALGNTYRGSPGDHVVRWQVTERDVISHNRWLGLPKAGLHQLKFHAGLYEDGNFGGVNEYSVVSHNFCSGNNGPWAFTLGQQGPDNDERASRMIIENNYFQDANGSVSIFVLISADTSRFSHNVCEQKVKGEDDITCGYFGLREPWPIEGQHRAYANVLFNSVPGNAASNTVTFDMGGAGNRAGDNIVWAPRGGTNEPVTGLGTCAPGACAGNRSTKDFNAVPFISEDPRSLDDYRLR